MWALLHAASLAILQTLLLLQLCLVSLQQHICRCATVADEFLRRCLRKLLPPRVFYISSRPSHMAFVFLEEKISVADVAKTLFYSAKYNVHRVTLYEPSGYLQQSSVCKELDDRCRELLLENSSANEHVKWLQNNNSDVGSISFLFNGCSYSKHRSGDIIVDVRIFSSADGRGCLISATRELCESVRSLQRSSKEITKDLISSILEDIGHSEVDLLLKFGQVDSLLGFPPWSLRVVEMIPLATHQNFDEVQFLTALEQFQCRERRLGK